MKSPLTAATEELRDAVGELRETVAATHRLLADRLPDPRRPDLTAPQRSFSGPTGARMLRLFPAFALEWQRVVPATHVQTSAGVTTVDCCTPVQLAEVGALEPCPDCERWFLRTEIDVRVARWA